jgi:hypothetical protein
MRQESINKSSDTKGSENRGAYILLVVDICIRYR